MLICEPATPAQGRSCAVCSTPITHKPKQAQTCGRLCGAVLGKARSDAARHANAMARRQRTCRHCGDGFVRRSSGKPGENQFCSRVCSAAAVRKYATEAEARRAERDKARERKGVPPRATECRVCAVALPGDGPRRLTCSRDCGMEWARQQAKEANIAKDARGRSPRPCKQCGEPFAPKYGDKRRLFCSSRCLDRFGNAYYPDKAKNHRQRARKAGVAYEPVNRLGIFGRDGWRCQVCGIKTSKAKIGTTHPRAPELDHRIPLALGGGHTWANCQCACRQCNNLKGGHRVVGQLTMFPRPAP
jgi:5-methylcytosine-specific restriction endonuclease McrA/predicted nucleic acid-binding Zn ribbon protein